RPKNPTPTDVQVRVPGRGEHHGGCRASGSRQHASDAARPWLLSGHSLSLVAVRASCKKRAATTIYLAASPDVRNATENYVTNCKPAAVNNTFITQQNRELPSSLASNPWNGGWRVR